MPMSVLLCLLVAPLGLVVILGMSWFEDHFLSPPTSPADQVVRSQMARDLPVPGPVAQGSVELLRIVRAPQQKQLPPSGPQSGDTAA
ncbi:hypothetical protein [Streptacidiphilus sp. EB129]|uniref:hypothetical protein n=1 Tax=Streptacidiphilus sp. EB129 TaxID=3156262 RepID=UPI0035182A2D